MEEVEERASLDAQIVLLTKSRVALLIVDLSKCIKEKEIKETRGSATCCDLTSPQRALEPLLSLAALLDRPQLIRSTGTQERRTSTRRSQPIIPLLILSPCPQRKQRPF